MKKLVSILSLGLIGSAAFAVPNTDLFTDSSASGGTSYTSGANLVGQFNTNLFTPWYIRGTNTATTQPTIGTGSLFAPGIPLSSGNCASFVPANASSACLDFNVPASNTNTVYASFILKITDISAVGTSPANNSFAAFLDDPTATTFGGNQIGRLGTRLLTKAVGSGYVLGTSRSASTADYTYEPDAAAHSVNDTLFVVMGLQRISGTGGPTNCLLWINPPVSSYGSNQPPPATVVALSGVTALNNSARAFGIIQQSTAMPTGLIDDLRIATNWAFVTVGDPKIVTPPANRSVLAGNNATFTVNATGTGSLTYGWFKDGSPLSNSSHIGGAHTASVTVTNVAGGDLGGYVVYITNGLGATVFTPTATLSFITDPAVTNQPADFTGNYNTTATFTVGASGTAPLYYQWHRVDYGDLSDGGNISGSHSNILTLGGISFGDSGYYYVTVSNNVNQVDSSVATLKVIDPYFTNQPVSVTTNAGSTAQFNAGGSSSSSFLYQWNKNGSPLLDIGNISGSQTPTLTIANVSSSDQATYSCTAIGVTNTDSLGATLTVLTPVSVTIPPRSRTVVQGVRAVLSVGAGGSGPFTYQWLRSGTNVSGATSSAYSLSNVQALSSGDYSVVISNAFSAATSSVVNLSVSNSLSLAETNVIILRVGDGGQGLSVNGNSMFLDQYLQDGTYVSTITLPDDGPSSEVAIGWDNITGVNNGSTTGSSLTRSADGRFMVIAGYNTNLNYGQSLMASSGTNVPKGIMTVDSFGACVLAAAFTNAVFDNSFWRSAIYDGNNNYWGGSGIAGTYYFGLSNPAALVQTNLVNTRNLALWNGDIYGASAANGTGIVKVNGLATTNGSASIILNTANGTSSGTFDVAVNPAGNLIYVTDQRNVNNGGGIQRYDFNGSSWTLTYTLKTGFGNLGPRYITADFSGASPVLYVTSNDQTFDNNRLLKLVDTDSSATPTVLASASINQTFRGLHLGPVPNNVVARPTLNYSRDGNNLILSWSGSFHLQSAHEAAGTYVNVSGGTTSPYTNNVTVTNRLFFRLSN